MIRTTLLVFSILCAAFLIACSKSETMNNSNSTNTSKPAAAASKEPMAASTEKIGVPECDDFIAKYEACVSSKVPEMARAQYKSAVAQWRASWKKLAEDPKTKPTLAAACKQAAAQQSAALKAYGCAF